MRFFGLIFPAAIVCLVTCGAALHSEEAEYPECVMARNGDFDGLTELIANGLDVNNSSCNPDNNLLVQAARNGHLQIVRMLVDKGASIDRRDAFNGYSALWIATAFNHADTVRFLVSAGAPDTIAGWMQPCQSTAAAGALYGSTDSLQVLHEQGWRIRDQFGLLLYCNLIGSSAGLQTIEFLISIDSDVLASNWFIEPPVILAINFDRPDVLELLLKHGASLSVRSDRTGDFAHCYAQRMRASEVIMNILSDHSAPGTCSLKSIFSSIAPLEKPDGWLFEE